MLSCGKLRVPAMGRIAVVLDASDSAADQWGDILSRALDLFRHYPDAALYFLGNPRVYAYPHLVDASAQVWEENRNRGSFISPVFRSLPPVQRIVVIGSGPIFDLEDWMNTPAGSALLFVSLEESMRGPIRIGQELQRPSLPAMLDAIDDPVRSVVIGGTGFAPLDWDNVQYRFRMEGDPLRMSLTGDNLQDYSIRLVFRGSVDQIRILTRNGRRLEPVGWSAEPGADDVGIEGLLTTEEARILRMASRGEATIAHCPVCGGMHELAWRCLNPPKGTYTILGIPLFRSLAEAYQPVQNRRCLVRFSPKDGETPFTVYPGRVVSLSEETIGVITGDPPSPFVYRLDEDRMWHREAPMGSIYRSTDGCCVAYI